MRVFRVHTHTRMRGQFADALRGIRAVKAHFRRAPAHPAVTERIVRAGRNVGIGDAFALHHHAGRNPDRVDYFADETKPADRGFPRQHADCNGVTGHIMPFAKKVDAPFGNVQHQAVCDFCRQNHQRGKQQCAPGPDALPGQVIEAGQRDRIGEVGAGNGKQGVSGPGHVMLLFPDKRGEP